MRRLIEPSHLDLCCLQKPIIMPVAVKKLKDTNCNVIWSYIRNRVKYKVSCEFFFFFFFFFFVVVSLCLHACKCK